jgi:hypothetical protein
MRTSAISITRWLSVLFAAATFLAAPLALAKSAKPFKATIAIREFLQPVGSAPCFFLGHSTGTGNATHMGKVSVSSTDCINFADPTNPSPAFLAFSSTQPLVITAANGDQVRVTYAGTFTIEDGVGTINGGYQIVGGTGRFSNATGAGVLQGSENISVVPAQGEIQITGTISY